MSFADRIKRIRIEYGLTQKDLAKIAGVSDNAVSTWEKQDGKMPRMGVVQKIADHFNMKKTEVLDLDECKVQNIADIKQIPDDEMSIKRINRMRSAGLSEKQIDFAIDYSIALLSEKKPS